MASKIIPIVRTIERKMSKFDFKTEDAVNLKENVLNSFRTRFSNIQKDKLAAVATLLDPRYKKLYFNDEEAVQDAIDFIKDDKVEPDSDKENSAPTLCTEEKKEEEFWDLHEELVSSTKQDEGSSIELELYLREPPISRDGNAISY